MNTYSINLDEILYKNSQELNHISKIYVIINKDKEIDRYNYLVSWFKKQKISNYQFFNYCYGDNISEIDIQKYYKKDDKLFIKKCGLHYVLSIRDITLSEISLAINHIKVLEDAVKRKYKSILILESDAIFVDDFKNKWNNIYSKELPENWDTVVLGTGNYLHIDMTSKLFIDLQPDKHIYANPRHMVKCTEATMFSLNACQQILKNIIPFNTPIDHEYDYHLLQNKLNVYMCEPPLVSNGSVINKYKGNIQQNDPKNVYFSQIGQDKYYVENIIKHRKNGTFLDIGAYDGKTFSNTYYLEKVLEWKGICVEPNPEMYKKCRETRKNVVNKAIYEKSGEKIDLVIPSRPGNPEQLCGLYGHIREKSLTSDFVKEYSQYTTVPVETISLNELLDSNKLYDIDYMSLDIEGYELNVLKSINYNWFKIKFITVEHGNDKPYQLEIQKFLESKNYVLHRNNKWDDEYMLNETRETVNSFDIFDTLLARKVKIPTDIFKIIEKKYGIPEFYNNRIKAEQLSNGYFDDIYSKFKMLTGTNDQTIEQLKLIEIETEKANLIPICSNIEKVRSGDILVSDMYLPLNVIGEFLTSNGLSNKNVKLFVTPNGKSSGQIWNWLKDEFNIRHHYGDNLHSDVNMPRKVGIHGVYTQIHKFTELEMSLPENLAHILREFRLLNPFDETSDHYILYDEQCRNNIILLCLFAMQIYNIATKENKNKILFTTRDCCLLEIIFKYMYPDFNAVTYYSSRLLYKNYTKSYQKYISEIYDDNSIIIDLNGSFQSGRKIYMDTFGKLPRVHLLCYTQAAETFSELSYSCLHSMDDYIELLNSGNHGSIIYIDNNKIQTKALENKEEFVTIIRNTVINFIQFIENKNFKDILFNDLTTILKDKPLVDKIFSNTFFTGRYKNLLIN